ncbi:uncharacterized protein si:dkey-86e18.1 isoform X2 [Solea solea]|uniref:uncharacterized protein si:dkey-86e18.1 isoform X2 n=1 Tax=Solea solea TaxID=90069 RepID=UPI00272B1D8C|nr:uncharacterized protein si:dkey-86e18.1 isoform X2 [Solea solea]
MARNEEKQQGRLNRLWLQKEREEGRLKDVHDRRPKLSTLNSASSVKKWIPSIKNEIEYYLQSQLSHYPERKIAEFQLCVEALEREYKRFITKLRVLDPSCKHKPWTPRAYCKRRAESEDTQRTVKEARHSESQENSGEWSGTKSDLTSSLGGCYRPLSCSVGRCQTSDPINLTSETSETDQNQPLSFDQTRLAVAIAAFRGPSVELSSPQTQNLARVLQSGLPNLTNHQSVRQICSSLNRDTEEDGGTSVSLLSTQKSVVQECKSDCEEKSSNTSTAVERTGQLLGLDCYSSSDDDCDTPP